MFISLSLFRYFSLSSSICVSVSLLLSILLCGFSVIFLCYFVCLSSGFCFCASHGAFSKSFPFANAQAQSCAQNCVLCVLSILFVFLLGFAFAKSSKQDNRARATGTQTRMQVPRSVYQSVYLSVCLPLPHLLFSSYFYFNVFFQEAHRIECAALSMLRLHVLSVANSIS